MSENGSYGIEMEGEYRDFMQIFVYNQYDCAPFILHLLNYTSSACCH